MDEQPMSYLLFKLNMEMNYQDTFEKDEKVRKKYEEYLQSIERSKKKGGE
jgi:predicted RND superfamily exporter protein